MIDDDLPEDYPLTAREFLHLPMASGKRYELLQGELFVPPSPETKNARIGRNLLFKIQTQLDAEPFGEVFIALTAVVLSKFDVVEPDLFVIKNEQQAQVKRNSFNGAPAMVFEIVSLWNRRMNMQRKALLYSKSGVEEYWMVDPEKRRILIQRLVEGKVDLEIFTSGSVSSAVLPGFTVEIGEIFA